MKKKIFYVAEAHAYSYREATEIQAADLDEAKKIAEDMQVFQGTVLKIGDVNAQGFIVNPIAIKRDGEDWEDIYDYYDYDE